MKLILSFMAFALMTTTSFASHYGKAGCGLGSKVMGKDSQVLAATTNGTSGNQTFGISSGTSGCNDEHGSAMNYINNNKLALSNDISKGSGETITGLSQAYGCKDTALLGKALQGNYGQIFESTDRGAPMIERSIKQIIRSDSSLANTCQV